MALVPIPPPRLGEYRMDLATTAAAGGGISRLRSRCASPTTDRRVTSLATIHERPLHLFVIDRSLQFFRHVHPTRVSDGTFELARDDSTRRLRRHRRLSAAGACRRWCSARS
jgi:hypothetical protein